MPEPPKSSRLRRFSGTIAAATARARELWQAIEPGSRAWSGAAWGLLLAVSAVIVARSVNSLGDWASFAITVLSVPLGLAYALAGGVLLFVVAGLLSALPARFRIVLASSLFFLAFEVFPGSLWERVIPTAYVIVSSTVAGAAIGVFFRWRTVRTSRVRVVLAAGGFAASIGASALGLAWLLGRGQDNAPAIDAAAASAEAVPVLDLPDPSQPGPHRVRRLFYGSGTDKRRPEYGARVDLRTRSVDGRAYLRGWGGFDGWARARYWGFDARALPINARVFYPEGEGPFPVAVIVHGGHPTNDFSDPGYDYLGEHLASWGFVFVSVDENFLNMGPWGDFGVGLNGENGARGWLLLEHLRQIRAFHEDPATPLHRKVDLGRIALLGHSRGGEAIAIAAAYNKLTRNPDDALAKLDYGFGIRALVALSTTDKQFQPGGVGARIEDVDFLALQGSNDGDNDYFQGMQQYDRVHPTGARYHLKAAVYVHRANHGQWNRVWGNYDKSRFPKRLYFNRKPILPADQQERVAKAYVTAFLSASLREDKRWLPFLRDHRAGRKWLPATIYITRFEDSERRWLSRFEEDVDVTTTTLPGGRIAAQGLTVWREQPPGPQSLWSALEGRAAYLGWDNAARPGARYTLELPADLDPASLGDGASLVFALADAHEDPRSGRPQRIERPRRPIDLTIEVTDRWGTSVRLPLAAARLLQPQLESNIWKAGLMVQQRREIVFQSFEIPLARFAALSEALDLHALESVGFVFDRTPAGVVVLDDIGFAP
jgi:hypothetical protein